MVRCSSCHSPARLDRRQAKSPQGPKSNRPSPALATTARKTKPTERPSARLSPSDCAALAAQRGESARRYGEIAVRFLIGPGCLSCPVNFFGHIGSCSSLLFTSPARGSDCRSKLDCFSSGLSPSSFCRLYVAARRSVTKPCFSPTFSDNTLQLKVAMNLGSDSHDTRKAFCDA